MLINGHDELAMKILREWADEPSLLFDHKCVRCGSAELPFPILHRYSICMDCYNLFCTDADAKNAQHRFELLCGLYDKGHHGLAIKLVEEWANANKK